MALCMVVGYYTFSYRPDLDPFKSSDQAGNLSGPSYKPNPVDNYFLYRRLSKQRKDITSTKLSTTQERKMTRRQHMTIAFTQVRMLFMPSLMEYRSDRTAVYDDDERLPAHHWIRHPSQWLCSTAMWYLSLPLGSSCETRLVVQHYTPVLSDVPT
jgi:hypothetical protein